MSVTPRLFALAAAAVIAFVIVSSRDAHAHSGNPAVAFLTTPPVCGSTVTAGDPLTIRWIDSDVPIATGTATVDLFYTQRRPPTFLAGVIPVGLEGEPIALGIFEADRTNAYTWTTSTSSTGRRIEHGTYLIWSRVNEPAIEMSLSVISFSPGTVSIVRPPEEPFPQVNVSKPDSPFRFADHEFVIEYCARSTRPATVKLEATPLRNGEGLELLADGLPGDGLHTFTWNTNCLNEANWAIKVTITDDLGRVFENWSRYFVLTTHPFAPKDAGGLNAGCVGPDASVEDAGEPVAPPGGCDCTAVFGGESALGLALAIWALALRRRR